MKKNKMQLFAILQFVFFMCLTVNAKPVIAKSKPYSQQILKGKNFSYKKTGKNLLQISMPMGGIGAGSIGLSGIGSLMDFSIYGKPDLTAVKPWGSEQAGFAVLHIKGNNSVTRVLEGMVPKEQIYLQGIKGQGFISSGVEGLPRFENCTFTGKYPFGKVDLNDKKIPLSVSITGYNPFIPLDDKNSSIPCIILEYTLQNTSKEVIDYDFSYSLTNLCGENYFDTGGTTTRNSVLKNGIKFSNTLDSLSNKYGDATLTVIGENPKIKGMWLRSEWQWDWLSALWRDLSGDAFSTNNGSNGIDISGRNGGTILMSGKLLPGQSKTYPIVVTWHFPNRSMVESYKKPCDTCSTFVKNLRWQPYYVSQWKNAVEVADYVSNNYSTLRAKTVAFQEALYNSSIPNYVIDAIASNLAIIKSPTLLRLKSGNLWGWEGITPDKGVGPGTNIHVYNYAQSLANLFPNLERTLREQELLRSLDDNGHVNFRAALPDGPSEWAGLPAADGQLGGVMKVYRDYSISGDLNWLKKMYAPTKKSLDYCIETWDPKHKGIVEEPHHNTYDIEFWGPDGMNTSIYLGALSSMIELAKANNMNSDTLFYSQLLQKGKEFFQNNLFNGSYFKQNVVFTGLKDTSFVSHINNPKFKDGEINQLLRKEGPRYQYGNGCLSDGIIGVWMSTLYGLPIEFDKTKINSHLNQVFENNFKADIQNSEHACTQRPGYALGHEPGLLLCTWPNGGKPTLPFVYSDEVWTGIEYQVASHMIMQGLVNEGLTIIRGTRYRYDGFARNPYAEYEFGSFYARAMSSYALLESLTGITYSGATKVLKIAPKLNVGNHFQSFFSTSSAYGTISIDKNELTIKLLDGSLSVSKIELTINGIPKVIGLNKALITNTKTLKF